MGEGEQHSLTVECAGTSVKASTSSASVALGTVGMVCGTVIAVDAIRAATMKN